jgi:type IV secretion system protein VirD4
MINAERDRFGSGGFADMAMLGRAGLYRQDPAAFYVGNDDAGRPLHASGQGGIIIVAGARAGKLATILGYNLCGPVFPVQNQAAFPHILATDVKRELAYVAQNQCFQGRRVINWDPRGNGDLPRSRINALSYLKAGSRTLYADAKVTAMNICPVTGSPNGRFFEMSGQMIIEAVIVADVLFRGETNLPRIASLIGGMMTANEEYLAVEFEMLSSGNPQLVNIANEIKRNRNNPSANGDGWRGIMAELRMAFSWASDPQICEALSPPFDFDFEELTRPGPPYLVNLMEWQDFLPVSGPAIRALYTCAMVHKRRALNARPQRWILEELGNMGSAFPAAAELYTIGAGFNIQPVGIFQSFQQMRYVAPDAENIIPSSAAVQLYFALRHLPDAMRVSKMIGTQTLEYDDFPAQERARKAQQEAVMVAFLGRGDPFQAMMEAAHQQRIAAHRSKQARDVQTPDEVMNDAPDRAYLFMPGVLEKPAYVRRAPYWTQRALAGRYLPNPFHPPRDSVPVQTAFGAQRRRIITEAVPARFASWPQYRSGQWSYVEGYRS